MRFRKHIYKKGGCKMFEEKVISVNGIDMSGSDSYRRFDFQIACVFETLLTLCKKNEDFYVLLDFLDDFVIIQDVGKISESITFCQTKTQSKGPFTISMVVRKEWLKKQVANYHSFIDSNVKNILITNFGIQLKRKLINDSSIVSLDTLQKEDGIQELISQIKNELNGLGDIKDFYLLKASLSLDGFEEQIKGLLLNYASTNNYQSLSAEAIQTIYIKIWKELDTKQHHIPTIAEIKSKTELINKKGIRYTHIKEIFKTAMDIDVPNKSEISSFFSSHGFDLDSLTIVSFLTLFHDFRIDCATYGAEILEECCSFLEEHKSEIALCTNSIELSQAILNLLFRDEAVSQTDFFCKYKICISALFAYKLFNEN